MDHNELITAFFCIKYNLALNQNNFVFFRLFYWNGIFFLLRCIERYFQATS